MGQRRDEVARPAVLTAGRCIDQGRAKQLDLSPRCVLKARTHVRRIDRTGMRLAFPSVASRCMSSAYSGTLFAEERCSNDVIGGGGRGEHGMMRWDGHGIGCGSKHGTLEGATKVYEVSIQYVLYFVVRYRGTRIRYLIHHDKVLLS